MLVVLVLFFPQLDPAGMNLATAVVFVLLGSFSFVGIGMMAAILPLLYVERGAQMTFVLQSCLLLVSGVYYPVEVLPGWMQVLSHLSPATYVLDGVRAGLLDGTPVTALVGDIVPLLAMGVVLIPAGPLGLRARRAVREAHRQAQAGGLTWTTISASDTARRSDSPARLGPGLGRRLPAVRRGGLGAGPRPGRPSRRLGRRHRRLVTATPSSPVASATRPSGPATCRPSATGSRRRRHRTAPARP